MYQPPEIFTENHQDFCSDVWAMGCILYEMCAGERPFNNISEILKGEYDKVPSYYSSKVRNLIEMCLNMDYNERPSVDDILNELE